MKDKSCLNCIYFDQFKEQHREDNVLGACKCNPPFPARDKKNGSLGEWPLVLGSFFCGMFNSGDDK